MTTGRWSAMRDRATRLLRNDALMRIAANSGWLLGDRLVRAALGFFVAALVARYLGPADYGQYAYVLTFITFFQAIALLGADNIVVRDIAREPDAAAAILGSTLRLRALTGLACWLAAVALAALIDPAAHRTIAMTALVGGILFFQSADTVDLWFQSQSQNRRTVVAKLAAYFATAGVKVALVLAGAPLIAFSAAFLLDFIGAALALGLAYRRFPTPDRWAYDRRVARQLLRESWPFLLSTLSITVYMRVDQIMLKALRGTYDVGIYAAALPLSQIWQMIPVTMAISFGPYIARQKRDSEIAYQTALRFTFRLFGGLALLASLTTVVIAPWLLPAIYGPHYVPAVPVLQIHVFTNVFIALGVAQSLWIANERRGNLLLTQTLCGAAVALAGNWLLIPLYGPIGAAMAAVAAQFTAVLLVNLVVARPLFWLQMGRRPR